MEGPVSLVLIDLITRLRGEGLSRYEAIVEAEEHRFRPILMTALTTIFGLMPIAVGKSSLIGVNYAGRENLTLAGLKDS